MDAAFLSMESRARPMHLGAVAVFRGPVSPARVLAVVTERAARLPALRVTGNWFPSWWPASDFDPAAHVHDFAVSGRRAICSICCGIIQPGRDFAR